ncbi:MAG: hypothetical protein H0U18_07990 [Pyrinomonadaceae bacterium]|nr:hypothetical protein [Pyrinomonadaceae bacterium]
MDYQAPRRTDARKGKVQREAPRKRATFAAGATYGESWQSKAVAPSDGAHTPTTYHHRGVPYPTYEAWQAAVSA